MNIKYMDYALKLAETAFSLGEVPVGAVIVKKSTGEIIGEGYNLRETEKNALAHAEIIAINQACKKLGGWRLPDCEIYITLEPCLMCCGAIINARIDNIFFGAFDQKNGSTQKIADFPYNYKPQISGGIMQAECSEILSRFFKQLRENKKNYYNYFVKIH